MDIAGSAGLLHAALMAATSPQVVVDTDDRLVVANPSAMHLLGLTADDLGCPVQDLGLPLEMAELQARAPAYDVRLVPLLDADGAVVGTTILFHDAAQTRQLRDQLARAQRRVEVAYEELHSNIEELESTDEELQRAVEELQSTLEALHSTDDELQGANQELESATDELRASNESLRDRQDDVERLNRFMGAVLGGLGSAMAAVDRDLRVLAWNQRAEDLWGVRTDEAVGAQLMDLEVGLPLERLVVPLRDQLESAGVTPHQEVLEAVDRAGARLRVRVSVTRMEDHDRGVLCAMLLMDVLT